MNTKKEVGWASGRLNGFRIEVITDTERDNQNKSEEHMENCVKNAMNALHFVLASSTPPLCKDAKGKEEGVT